MSQHAGSGSSPRTNWFQKHSNSLVGVSISTCTRTLGGRHQHIHATETNASQNSFSRIALQYCSVRLVTLSSAGHIHRFSYHFKFAVEVPMQAMSKRPSPLRSPTAQPAPAIPPSSSTLFTQDLPSNRYMLTLAPLPR